MKSKFDKYVIRFAPCAVAVYMDMRQNSVAGFEGSPDVFSYDSERDSNEAISAPRKASNLSDRPQKNVSNKWSHDLVAVGESQDTAAFERLFNEFAPRIKAFLIKSGSDHASAEEHAQEAMATVWRKAHMFDPSRASAATWMFTIARNKKIDAIRKQRRPEPEDIGWGPEHEPDQEDVIGLQQESEKLGNAIEQLPEKQRLLLERAYFADMSHSEIADVTGLPLGTIKSRIRLALERLRHSMT